MVKIMERQYLPGQLNGTDEFIIPVYFVKGLINGRATPEETTGF